MGGVPVRVALPRHRHAGPPLRCIAHRCARACNASVHQRFSGNAANANFNLFSMDLRFAPSFLVGWSAVDPIQVRVQGQSSYCHLAVWPRPGD